MTESLIPDAYCTTLFPESTTLKETPLPYFVLCIISRVASQVACEPLAPRFFFSPLFYLLANQLPGKCTIDLAQRKIHSTTSPSSINAFVDKGLHGAVSQRDVTAVSDSRWFQSHSKGVHESDILKMMYPLNGCHREATPISNLRIPQKLYQAAGPRC